MARVLVIGAGFAGVEAVSVLSRLGVCERHECVWVAPGGRMVFTPLVPALVSRRYRREDIEWSVERLAHSAGAQLVVEPVERLEKGAAVLRDGERLGFDYAIIAAGARPAFYGVPGAEENSLTLYGPGEAERLAEALERGEARSVVVVGAGFVGVEVAGELLWYAQRRGVEARVTLVDMLSEPLGLLGNRVASLLVREALAGMGAGFRLGSRVVEVTGNGVRLEDGSTVQGDLVVWSAGFRGPDLGLPRESLARGWFIRVDQMLRVPGFEGRVYAAGDAAAIEDERGCKALKMAREAVRSAETAAINVAASLTGSTRLLGYTPKLTSCAPQAGVSLGPEHGVMIIGRGVAFPSRLPQLYHERLRESYEALLAGELRQAEPPTILF